MTEETTPNPEENSTAEAKPAPAKAKPAADGAPAKAKKEKAPALEDKPFNEFIEQDFNPALKEALAKQGLKDVKLSFAKQPLAAVGSSEQYWQVQGDWQDGQRQFNLYFIDENINGKKAFSYANGGAKPSTLESFMIDERKVTLDLLLLYTLQRLNGQKWLQRN
jgi:Protein of unknown function (DUF2996)